MIYTVEQCINEPLSDEEWSQWSGEMKPVPMLMAVKGFTSAQRFKGINDVLAPSIAVYSVVSADVLNSDDYFQNARGGNLGSPRWKPRMKYWYRNLFSGMERAPGVPKGSVLVVLDSDRRDAKLGDINFTWLTCEGLDKTTAYRGMAIMTREQATPWLTDQTPGLNIYTPLADIALKD